MSEPERPEPTLRHVNVAHERQDVHATRQARPGLFRFRVAGDLLPRAPEAGAPAAGIGGGMGEFADAMAARGYAVTLVDLSESNIAAARARGHAAERADLNEPLPFPDGAFAAVALLEVIEHVVNAELLLAEAVRVLRPGGFLVLSTPNAAWFRERWRSVRGLPPSEEGYHYRFFTVASLRALFRRVPAEIVEERYRAPAFGVNLVRRLSERRKRVHVLMPRAAAPWLAQTSFVLARKRA